MGWLDIYWCLVCPSSSSMNDVQQCLIHQNYSPAAQFRLSGPAALLVDGDLFCSIPSELLSFKYLVSSYMGCGLMLGHLKSERTPCA